MSSPAEELLSSYASTKFQVSASYGSTECQVSASTGTTTTFDMASFAEDQQSRVLKQCEKTFLKPYHTMLQILGWAPNKKWRCVQFILIVFWYLIIVTTSLTQIFSCLNRVVFIPGETEVQTIQEQNKTVTVSKHLIKCENRFIATFILLDILTITSYTFGIYLFSKGEKEYLFTLAGKVFLKTSEGNLGKKNGRITWTIFAFFLSGIVWIILSVTVRILKTLSVNVFTEETTIGSNLIIQGAINHGLTIFSHIGFIFFDVVYVAAVMNYVAQSEMNIYLLCAIKSFVLDNKYHNNMKEAMKDIVECRECLRVLNGKTATATAIILFNLGSAALVSLITLNEIGEQALPHKELALAAAGLNVSLWIVLISFPFVQAARVTHAADKLKETGPEIPRLQLYENTPPLDLIYYLHLTQAIKLRATMFGIPIHPWMMYAALVAFTFTMLVLHQCGLYNSFL